MKRRIADRIFGLLLRMLPFDFRADHGREMEQVFRTQRRESRGMRAIAGLWFETIQDVLATAPAQHVQVLRQDVGYALRTFRRAPVFAAVAVITFAIGIGGATSVFTVVNAFLFRPLPVDRPGELVSIASLDRHLELPHSLSYPDLQDYRRGQAALSDMAGFEPAIVWLADGSTDERILIDAVTSNYFSMLGVRPAAGRMIAAPEGTTTGDSPVIMLAYDYWQRRFGGNPSVIGRAVRVNGHALTVVGVTAQGFRGANPLVRISGFVPVSMLDLLTHRRSQESPQLEARDREGLTVLGRLAAGVTVDQARAALQVVTERLAQDYPGTNAGRSLLVVREALARPHPSNGPIFHVIAAVFSGLAGLLLLIASANIANILLARAAARSREVALRSALGARQGRLVRQFLTESLLLAALGSAGAIPLGFGASRAMEQSLQSAGLTVPIGVDFSLDWRVLAVCWGVSVAAGVTAGLAPAIYAFRADIVSLLKTGGTSAAHAGSLRFQKPMIVAQIAVSLALLVFGGLFAKALTRARDIDLGFRTADVLVANVDLRSQGYDEARRRMYFTAVRERVAALPGVRNASWVSALPFGYSIGFEPIHVEGAVPHERQPPTTLTMSVDQHYFATASVPVRSGRAFDERDNERSTPVGIVNEMLASQMWPGSNPIGRRVRMEDNGPWIDIIGVVANSKLMVVWETPRPLLLRPLAQQVPGSAAMEVVMSVAPGPLTDTVRRTIQAADTNVTPYDLQTMARYLNGGNGFMVFRVGAVVAGAFGLLGLVLASTGVYGVMACHVSQRTTEFGVRMAMGADRRIILRDVLARGAWLAAVGAALGALIAASVARLMRTLLLGVSPFDPGIYIGLSLALGLVCILASLIPARRATAVDPVEALRGNA